MKKITSIFLMFFFAISYSQVTNRGEPISWKVSISQRVPAVVLPAVNMKKLMAEDAVNDLRRDIPWRFGKEILVSLSTENSGVWTELNNGDRIWRLKIQSEGAKTLNFVFNDFFLPEGSSLYFYNQERTYLLGAYTSSMNRADRQFGSWLVDGDTVWLEYFEPESKAGQGSLQISKVVHGYRSVTERAALMRALNDSGDCNLDVNCPIGSDFISLKDVLKRSVALFLISGSLCSGALINNTQNNNAPYFLTADHCDDGNPGSWAFRFNWISPNPSCATTTNSTNGSFNQTTSGATKLAGNSQSDFMLVNIDTGLPTSWNLVWSGWNRSATDIPNFTVGIHHPAGDIMKVCRDNQAPTKVNISINGNTTQTWRVADWDLGVTEGGSSGSPLFNQNGRIVGQLAGGAAACSGTNDNNQPDYYGRLDVSWNFGTSNSTRLSNWLDPAGTGAMTAEILNTPDFQYIGSVSVYPNPVSDFINVTNNNSSQLSYDFFSITGKLIKSGILPLSENLISVEDLSEGIYFLKLQDVAVGSSLTKKVVVKK